MDLLKYFNCNVDVPVIDGIYQFTNDIPISLDDDKPKYLGYENVGKNFLPEVKGMVTQDDGFGAYGSSSRLLIKLLGKGCSVLDLGTGLGSASIPLALYGANVIAIDISQEMLRHAVNTANEKSIVDNIIIARMNAYELKFNDHIFDAVVVNDVMHQMEQPQLVFNEIRQILKPDGIYVQYGFKGLPVTDEQAQLNNHCNEVINDITDYYHNKINATGYVSPVSFYSNSAECIEQNLELVNEYVSDDEHIWTSKMYQAIHKLKTRANGHSQLIPDDIHNDVWLKTDSYAREKYGDDYINIPNYSHFTGTLKVYKLK